MNKNAYFKRNLVLRALYVRYKIFNSILKVTVSQWEKLKLGKYELS